MSGTASESATTLELDRRIEGRAIRCRHCHSLLRDLVVDLGMAPLTNSYPSATELHHTELTYPLRLYVCRDCFLVQLEDVESAEHLFSHDYPYFSSYSSSWLQHAQAYVGLAVERFGLASTSRVIEIASNDGYLLQYFSALGIPVLGIEPAANVAAVAVAKGIPTRVQFFGEDTAGELAREGVQADLIVANNVLAHVPDPNGFVKGMKRLLKPGGVVTVEFPHLLRLIAENQFDTIYQEHFSYFSLAAVERIFMAHGLSVFDVEELPSHGGSLRLYARHCESAGPSQIHQLAAVRLREQQAGLNTLEGYTAFGESVKEVKRRLLAFLIAAKREGKSIAAYGAPAKGNTLLNYCGVRTDFIDFTVDRNPRKQGCVLPGSRVPIYAPERIKEARPDYVLVLPWNLKDEIMEQLAFIRSWGGRFVVPIPETRIYE